MAINISYNGATIYRPGAYSKTTVDIGGGFPIGAAGIVAVIGEADAGKPGASEVQLSDIRYTGNQMTNIRNKYVSGPLVDMTQLLFAPAVDAAIPNGAQQVYLFKTNASVQASLALDNAYGTLKAKEYGIGGNRVSFKVEQVNEVVPSIESSAAFDEGLITNNMEVLTVFENGEKKTFKPAVAAFASLTALQTALANAANWGGALPSTFLVTASGADDASKIKIQSKAYTNIFTVKSPNAAVKLTADAVFTVESPVLSTASFDSTSIAAGTALFAVEEKSVQDGTTIISTNTFTLKQAIPAGTGSHSKFAAEFAKAVNWSNGLPINYNVLVTGSDGASKIQLSIASSHNLAGRLGYGRCFEVINANPLIKINDGFIVAPTECTSTLTLNNLRDNVVESEAVGGEIVLEIGRDNTTSIVSSAHVEIDATSIKLKEAGSVKYTFLKSSYATIGDLVKEINLATYANWYAKVSKTAFNRYAISSLDQVIINAEYHGASKVYPARIKRDASLVANFFNVAQAAGISSQVKKGLPDIVKEISLSGGSRGATTGASIQAALDKLKKNHVNFLVPLFSRDATDDIADGLTDTASTYTIDAVHQMIKTHISLMKTTKQRSERQAVLSYKGSYANAKDKIGSISDGRLQLVIQDVKQTDVSGTVKWFQPYALASIIAGARAGSPIGTPLTYKFMNIAGLRHTGQAMSTADEDIVLDFDPDTQADDAIENGLTFLENPQSGGYRVVVDNTTYGKDANFLWNRANVIYAGDIIAYNFRSILEATLVGSKNTISPADVVSTSSNILSQFLAQGITVSTSDAPGGYKNLVARIEGNTIYVDVVVKVVEGIDFVLANITIQRASQ